jgi:hypothetical protein
MNNIQIRLGHTDSVNSTDRQNFLDVELKNTSKLIHFTDIKKTIDQYEQFKTEREKCNKYRLIATINPYCTNVLFNTFSEIVYAEGSEYCNAIIEGDSFDDSSSPVASKTQDIYGLSKPNHMQMIMNTEYSRPGSAKDSYDINGRKIVDEYYVYHPGFDIFNNHILRNTSFKIVNKPSNNTDKTFFNTIADKMRYADGSAVTYKRREDFDDSGNVNIPSRDKHLYDYDNILQFENGDAINANLTEENGWYGFINYSTIQSRDPNPSNNIEKFNELNIGRVMNNRKSCEFIDMYPDRTLYSFNPKYNKYRHREEYNWEVILTYPYRNTMTDEEGNDYKVLKSGKCNGLLILSALKTIGPSGETIILFRTMTKHGLKRGDNVRFYYEDVDDWKQYEKDFKVRNIGNLENNEKEYYFYINDMDFIRLIDPDTYDDMDENNDDFKVPDKEYRFARMVGNVPSKYYIRKFKKLPNFKYAEQKFPKDGSITIDEYIENNAKDNNGKMTLFDKEQYKLAFETTIYNDESTQIVFTDTIDIDNLVDNRGCPITEIYMTIIKTNYGHDLWYNGDGTKRNDETVEFSHCFGEIKSGLQFSQKNEYGTKIYNKRKDEGDVTIISHKNQTRYEENITLENDEFFGDIVDFNPNECIEKSLQFFMHRFNTAQRELNNGKTFKWNEIWSDDWDANPKDETLIITKTGDDGDYPFSVIEKDRPIDIDDSATNREEGYYYQPHYRIPLREFGPIVQGQHFDININTIVPVQADAIYLKITTVRRSGVDKGDIIYLFDDKNDKIYEFVVTYVENRVSFYVIPRVKEGNPWQKFNEQSDMNWLDVCNLSVPYIDDENPDKNREAQLFFRRKNEDIPSYAEKVGKNKYLWRNVLRVGDMDTQELPEYAYANDAFYVTNEINFFLKRQDPNGWNGLYCKEGFPNDIPGNIKPESNYIYKEDKEIIC